MGHYLPSKRKRWVGDQRCNTFNLALLAKWKWDLFHHHGQLWARVLEFQYGGWKGLNEAPRSNSESIWWRDLKMVFHHSGHGEALQKSIEWRVGCGDRIKFWEDNWVGGDKALLAKYPRLYIISNQQNQNIQQMGSHKDSGGE
ncbi:hypothetical protein JHK82_026989 [Glycine max]|nr:hypothetical protein JHK82_026989 [Glycine max]